MLTDKTRSTELSVARWLKSAAALSLMTALAAEPALAQEASSEIKNTNETETDSGEILVTAQRREERLQDVPISITAVGSEEIARRQVADISQLTGAIPGLTIGGAAGSNASNIITIRGVTGLVQAIGGSQGAGVYLDGVYLSRPDAAFFVLDDVERLEVLRGPQGTLYGRNTTAGAINIITREPKAELQGGADVSYGDYDSLRARGSLSGPIADSLYIGISGSYSRHKGYLVNEVTGNSISPTISATIRGKLRYAVPDGSFSATLAGDWSKVNSVIAYKNAFDAIGNLVGFGDPSKITVDAASEAIQGQRNRSSGVALTINVKASNSLDITSITSFRKFSNFIAIDNDASAAPALLTATKIRNRYFNQELRGILDLSDFRLTFGGNYYHERSNVELSSGSPTAPLSFTAPIDTSNLNAIALFGQAEYDLTETLTAIVGLRYNDERRSFVVDYSQATPAGNRVPGEVKDDTLIPSFGLNYKIAPDVLLYTKASQGYLAPGFNGFPGRAASVPNTFRAEKLWAYEAGIKSQFLDRRITLNIAGFLYDYNDLQVSTVTGPGQSAIFNAANAKMKGIEGSLSVRPVPGLTLSAQATYLDARYSNYCQPITGAAIQGNDGLCAPGIADRSGNRLNLAPEWSGGLNVDYQHLVGGLGELSFNVSYSWESDAYFTAVNEQFAATGGWQRVDARIGLELTNGVEIYAFGKNLTNDRYAMFGARIRPGLLIGQFNDPRTYGVGARYRF